MWKCVVLFGLLVLEVYRGRSDGAIHFDLTDGDCSENSSVVRQCNEFYEQRITDVSQNNSYTTQLDCIWLLETIACVETAMCHCNFSADHPELEIGYRSTMVLYHYYNNITVCHNNTSDSIQADVMRPLHLGEGINCTLYNKTAGDLALSLAIAHIPQVTEAEEVCAGIQACFHRFDRDLEVALYRNHWPEFCLANLDLLDCLEQAACSCGQTTHDLVVKLVNDERGFYREDCDTINPDVRARRENITCGDVCGWDYPHDSCMGEFEAAIDVNNSRLQYCRSLSKLANCTETLACNCGFYTDSDYYRSLAVARRNYIVTYDCQQLTGRFPDHPDLNCGDDDRFSEEEKMLSISLAEPDFVEQEEASCSGIRQCYVTANAKSTRAYRLKDLSAICQAHSELITCMENAYCHCSRLHDQDVYDRMFQERSNQGNLCHAVSLFPSLTRCRGASTCQKNDPLSVCEAEHTYDTTVAERSYRLQCQSTKNYITCVEEVGCACGLLKDETSLAAMNNLTTTLNKTYNDLSCPIVTGEITSDEEGIQCPGSPTGAAEITHTYTLWSLLFLLVTSLFMTSTP